MIHVSAGILMADGLILLCRRLPRDPHPLKWEFPGGKAEAGETPEEALIRELTEELAIHVTGVNKIVSYPYQYKHREIITLHFFQILSFAGRIQNKAFQRIEWVRPENLRHYDLLAGDLEFLAWMDKHPHVLKKESL
ncbi:(deoxy)nucleoside triphosphate pyrophosphohydrolase [Fidelibacter multiformis]|uniref:(deoxy)nucleoside triphosphate pyrophosphohydrolase n=1 Tax=Fidelibacter multiformis TaxID=3377529 RepID=UPI0037DBFF6C